MSLKKFYLFTKDSDPSEVRKKSKEAQSGSHFAALLKGSKSDRTTLKVFKDGRSTLKGFKKGVTVCALCNFSPL